MGVLVSGLMRPIAHITTLYISTSETGTLTTIKMMVNNGLEAKIYSLVTGDQKTMEELDTVAERIFNLHRAITIRDMGTKHMRTRHDTIPPWVFEDPQGKPSLTKGTIRMDKEDMEKDMDLYYEEMGWDKATGAPTVSTYRRLGLAGVGDELKKKGLVP